MTDQTQPTEPSGFGGESVIRGGFGHGAEQPATQPETQGNEEHQ